MLSGYQGGDGARVYGAGSAGQSSVWISVMHIDAAICPLSGLRVRRPALSTFNAGRTTPSYRDDGNSQPDWNLRGWTSPPRLSIYYFTLAEQSHLLRACP